MDTSNLSDKHILLISIAMIVILSGLVFFHATRIQDLELEPATNPFEDLDLFSSQENPFGTSPFREPEEVTYEQFTFSDQRTSIAIPAHWQRIPLEPQPSTITPILLAVYSDIQQQDALSGIGIQILEIESSTLEETLSILAEEGVGVDNEIEQISEQIFSFEEEYFSQEHTAVFQVHYRIVILDTHSYVVSVFGQQEFLRERNEMISHILDSLSVEPE